jgi:hypothetical protein
MDYKNLCQHLKREVATPDGKGTLVQVFRDRACVVVHGVEFQGKKKLNSRAMYYPLESIFF